MSVINQIGRFIKNSNKSTQEQLTRFKQNIPYIERVSDYFSNFFPFNMEYRTYNKNNSVKMNVYFGEGVLATPIQCSNCAVNCPKMPSGSTIVYSDSFDRPTGPSPCGTYFGYFENIDVNNNHNLIFQTDGFPSISTDSNGVGYTPGFQLALNGAAGPPWSLLFSLSGFIPNIEIHGSPPYGPTPPSPSYSISNPIYADSFGSYGAFAAIYNTKTYYETQPNANDGPPISLRYTLESRFIDPATQKIDGSPNNTNNLFYEPITEPLLNFDPSPWTNSGRPYYLRYDCDGNGYGLRLWFQDEVEPSAYTVYLAATTFWHQYNGQYGWIPSNYVPPVNYSPARPVFPNVCTLVTAGMTVASYSGVAHIYGVALSGNITAGTDTLGPVSGFPADTAGWRADWCNTYDGPGAVFNFCAQETTSFSKTDDTSSNVAYLSRPDFSVSWEYPLFVTVPGVTNGASQIVKSFFMKSLVSRDLLNPATQTQIGAEPETITIRGQVTVSPDIRMEDGTPVSVTLEHMAMSYGDLTNPSGPTPYAYKYSMLGEVVGVSLAQYDKWTDFTIQISRSQWSNNNGKLEWGVRIHDPDSIPGLVGPRSGLFLLPDGHGGSVIFRNISLSPTYDFTGCSLLPDGFCTPSSTTVPPNFIVDPFIGG